MLGGSGYVLGSVAAGGPLSGVSARRLLIIGNAVMAILMGIAFSGLLGPVGTVALMPLATLADSFGWLGVVTLLTDVSPAGGAIGGLLLALSGYGALAAALLAWWPMQATADG